MNFGGFVPSCVCDRVKLARTCSNIWSNEAKSRNHSVWNILLNVRSCMSHTVWLLIITTLDRYNRCMHMYSTLYSRSVFPCIPTPFINTLLRLVSSKTNIFQIKIYKQPKGTFKRQNDLGIRTRINSYHSETRFIHDSTLHSSKFN